MGNKKDLKAYVRYDGTGRVISGSLILQRNKPKVGNWKQIGAYECCDPFCLPPVYGEDYIITNIIEGETGITVVISTNPFTGVLLEVGSVLCTSNPPNDLQIINTQAIPPGAVDFGYFVPFSELELVCAIAFRRICVPNKSPWALAVYGG